MSLAVFDPVTNYPGLKWSISRSPSFNTGVQSNGAGKTSRVMRWTYPIWRWTLGFELLRDNRATAVNVTPSSPNDELRQLVGFFLQQRGGGIPFALRDPSDNFIQNQTIATGSVVTSGNTDYPVVRSYGGFVEPVGAINVLTGLFVNGSPAGFTPNVPFDGWIRLDTGPPNGATIVASGFYYWKVTFPDSIGLDEFMFDFWQLNRLELVSQKQ